MTASSSSRRFTATGHPDDVRRFVDAAHAAGLGVILDVVYNHLGPSGNVLHEFSTSYFADHATEWGQGFNLDGECSGPVRHFMRENVRHWLEEYRFDGLRFDATQALVDRSPTHIVHELTRARPRVGGAPADLCHGRERTAGHVARAPRTNTDAGVDSLWNEDWHHSAFVALTGRREAYFTDYLGTAQEFAVDGAMEPAVPGAVVFLAEAAAGNRCPRRTRTRRSSVFSRTTTRSPIPGRAVASINSSIAPSGGRSRRFCLLGPSVPLLFQGQEEAVEQPFTYFADHKPPLAELVRRGRLEFLSQFPSLTSPEVA